MRLAREPKPYYNRYTHRRQRPTPLPAHLRVAPPEQPTRYENFVVRLGARTSCLRLSILGYFNRTVTGLRKACQAMKLCDRLQPLARHHLDYKGSSRISSMRPSQPPERERSRARRLPARRRTPPQRALNTGGHLQNTLVYAITPEEHAITRGSTAPALMDFAAGQPPARSLT